MELSDTPAYGVNGALTYEGAIARIEELEQALRAAQHDLTTTEGLTCADGLRAYGDALADGCDPNGAWDTFREQTWTLEHPSLELVDATLDRGGKSDGDERQER